MKLYKATRIVEKMSYESFQARWSTQLGTVREVRARVLVGGVGSFAGRTMTIANKKRGDLFLLRLSILCPLRTHKKTSLRNIVMILCLRRYEWRENSMVGGRRGIEADYRILPVFWNMTEWGGGRKRGRERGERRKRKMRKRKRGSEREGWEPRGNLSPNLGFPLKGGRRKRMRRNIPSRTFHSTRGIEKGDRVGEMLGRVVEEMNVRRKKQTRRSKTEDRKSKSRG